MVSDASTNQHTDDGAPCVSVVIAAYNAAEFIERAVRSVQAQSLSDFEILVVDDVSRDDTAAVVTRLVDQDPRVRLLRSPRNGGPSSARNIGIAAARGRWIAILDADDAYRPDRLETLVRTADKQSLDMVADNIVYYDAAANAEVGDGRLKLRGAFDIIDMKRFLQASLFRPSILDLSGHNILQYALLKFVFRRSFLLENHLRYPDHIRDGEDFYFYARCLRKGARAGLVASPGYLYTQRVGLLSGQASGQTRTVVDRTQVQRGVDELVAEHVGAFNSAEFRLLRQRKNQARGLQAFETVLARRRAGRPVQAICLLAVSPASWAFIWQAVVQRARRQQAGSAR